MAEQQHGTCDNAISPYYIVENAQAHVALRSRAREHVLLRRLCKADVPVLVDLLSDPENTKNDLSMANMAAQDILSLAERWSTESSPLEHCMMLVTLSDTVVGMCGFGVIRSVAGMGDHDQVHASTKHHGQLPHVAAPLREGILGIVVSQPFRGTGLAREALLMALDFGFQNLEFSQIVMGTTSKNIAMRKLMESPPPKGIGLQASLTTPDKFGNDLEWLLEKKTWHHLSAANLTVQALQ